MNTRKRKSDRELSPIKRTKLSPDDCVHLEGYATPSGDLLWQGVFKKSDLTDMSSYFKALLSPQWSQNKTSHKLVCEWLTSEALWKAFAFFLHRVSGCVGVDDQDKLVYKLIPDYLEYRKHTYALFKAYHFYELTYLYKIWPVLITTNRIHKNLRYDTTWVRLQHIFVFLEAERYNDIKSIKKLNIRDALMTFAKESNEIILDANTWLLVLFHTHPQTFINVYHHFGDASPLDNKELQFDKTAYEKARDSQPIMLPKHTKINTEWSGNILPTSFNFCKAMAHFTYNVLDTKTWQALPWGKNKDITRLFIAGGAVVYAASPHALQPRLDDAYTQSDVDFWIVGDHDDAQEYENTLDTCIKVIKTRCVALGLGVTCCVKQGFVTTLYVAGLRRQFQFITLPNTTPQDVVLNFDQTYIQAYTDGLSLYALPTCLRAWQTRTTHWTEHPLLPLRRMLKTWHKGFLFSTTLQDMWCSLSPFPETWQMIEDACACNNETLPKTWDACAQRENDAPWRGCIYVTRSSTLHTLHLKIQNIYGDSSNINFVNNDPTFLRITNMLSSNNYARLHPQKYVFNYNYHNYHSSDHSSDLQHRLRHVSLGDFENTSVSTGFQKAFTKGGMVDLWTPAMCYQVDKYGNSYFFSESSHPSIFLFTSLVNEIQDIVLKKYKKEERFIPAFKSGRELFYWNETMWINPKHMPTVNAATGAVTRMGCKNNAEYRMCIRFVGVWRINNDGYGGPLWRIVKAIKL